MDRSSNWLGLRIPNPPIGVQVLTGPLEEDGAVGKWLSYLTVNQENVSSNLTRPLEFGSVAQQ